MSTDLKTSDISIIIPTLNEASTIGKLLSVLHTVPGVEPIVVDGGSRDNTVDIAESNGAQVLNCAPGRAFQMNCGAKTASGTVLLFLHSDTIPPPGFAAEIRNNLQQPGVSAGAFTLSIGGNGFLLRLLEMLINFRARTMQMPYGDQGLFMTSGMFAAVGGFPEQPLMEDFELVRRLRRRGTIIILPIAATTSDRRWRRLGVLRTTLRNQAIIIGYLLGISPDKLAGWYRR
jgi:rSAM/selenodomain-associated transferase 2